MLGAGRGVGLSRERAWGGGGCTKPDWEVMVQQAILVNAITKLKTNSRRDGGGCSVDLGIIES